MISSNLAQVLLSKIDKKMPSKWPLQGSIKHKIMTSLKPKYIYCELEIQILPTNKCGRIEWVLQNWWDFYKWHRWMTMDFANDPMERLIGVVVCLYACNNDLCLITKLVIKSCQIRAEFWFVSHSQQR
jgi:hypothetical protein